MRPTSQGARAPGGGAPRGPGPPSPARSITRPDAPEQSRQNSRSQPSEWECARCGDWRIFRSDPGRALCGTIGTDLVARLAGASATWRGECVVMHRRPISGYVLKGRGESRPISWNTEIGCREMRLIRWNTEMGSSSSRPTCWTTEIGRASQLIATLDGRGRKGTLHVRLGHPVRRLLRLLLRATGCNP